MDTQTPNKIDPTEVQLEPQAKKSWIRTHRIATYTIFGLLCWTLIAGAYYYKNNQLDFFYETPIHHTETSDPTSNWITYVNAEYGFEFEYPKNWEIDDRQVNVGEFWLKEKGTENDFGMSEIFIGIHDNKANKKLTEIVTEKEELLKPYYDPDKQIKLAGLNAIQSRLVKPPALPTPCECDYISGLVKTSWAIKDNKVYEIFAAGEEVESLEKVYDQILSTFKFIEPVTWKTYIDPDYGFSFTYPSNSSFEPMKDNGYKTLRLQNYISTDDVGGLKAGEFYMEVYVAEQKREFVPCSPNVSIKSPKAVTINGISAVRGYGLEGGDAGGIRFVLCSDSSKLGYFVTVTENDPEGPMANKILDSFRFKK